VDATLAPEEKVNVDGGVVSIKTATIPHPSKRTSGDSQAFSKPKDDFGNQGFYVYREKRLISYGTWFNLIRKQEQYRLTRIQVDIPNQLDGYWALDVKKSFVRPPKELLDRLRDLIGRMGSPSRGIIRKRGRRLRAPEGVSPVWNQIRRDRRICWEVNTEHPEIGEILRDISAVDRNRAVKILKLISETLPVSDIYAEMSRNSEEVDVLAGESGELGQSMLQVWLIYTELLSLDRDEAIKKVLDVPPYNANVEKSRSALMEALDEFDRNEEEQSGSDENDDPSEADEEFETES
jgi:hypothetical protein